jgi:O-methyltransferase involved in polyketide biosynthesis
MSTLRFVAALARGSGLVFDYGLPPALLSPREQRGLECIATRTAEHGEPWKTLFVPETLIGALGSLGFSEVEDFDAERINARYFSGRADALRKSGVSRLICARV